MDLSSLVHSRLVSPIRLDILTPLSLSLVPNHHTISSIKQLFLVASYLQAFL